MEIQDNRRRAIAVVDHFVEVEHLGYDAIRERTGLPLGTIRSYRYDPTGEKRRKQRLRWAGRCIDCGAKTSGDRASGARDRCAIHARVPARWTRDAVLDAFAEWELEFGEPPTSYTLRQAGQRGTLQWPSYAAVQRAFSGSFRAGSAAYELERHDRLARARTRRLHGA